MEVGLSDSMAIPRRQLGSNRLLTYSNAAYSATGAPLSKAKVGFSVIDFGDARYDVWLADLRKLYGGAWANRPDLEQAFLQGYGRTLIPEAREQLHALAAVDKLETIVWSIEHRQAAIEAAKPSLQGN